MMMIMKKKEEEEDKNIRMTFGNTIPAFNLYHTHTHTH